MIPSFNDIKGIILEVFKPEEWPIDIPESSINWSEIPNYLCDNIIPNSTTKDIAKETFISILNQTSLQSQDGYFKIKLAFDTYVDILGSGMVGFTYTTPPPFNYIFTGMTTNSYNIEASNLANYLLTWIILGTATNINSGLTINWQ
jgi:hypothetical protein